MQAYFDSINKVVEEVTIDNLDTVTAYFLGLPAGAKKQRLRAKIEIVYKIKTGILFLTRFVPVIGGNNISAEMKRDMVEKKQITDTLVKINTICAKEEANVNIASFPYGHIDTYEFQQDFINYNQDVHNKVVYALSNRLASVASIVSKLSDVPTERSIQNIASLYSESNKGMTFLSLDLRQANWTILRMWDPSLPTWENFISPHLHESKFKALFLQSKNFRQVTLGIVLKKYDLMPKIEAMQYKTVKDYSTRLGLPKILGEIQYESNDELVFLWSKDSVIETIPDSKIRLSTLNIVQLTPDCCYEVMCRSLGVDEPPHKQLRNMTPKKLKDRLAVM